MQYIRFDTEAIVDEVGKILLWSSLSRDAAPKELIGVVDVLVKNGTPLKAILALFDYLGDIGKDGDGK